MGPVPLSMGFAGLTPLTVTAVLASEPVSLSVPPLTMVAPL